MCGWGSSLACRVVFLERNFTPLCLQGRGGGAIILLGMPHALCFLWPYAPCTIFHSHLLNCHHQIEENPQQLMWFHLLSELQLGFSSCQNAIRVMSYGHCYILQLILFNINWSKHFQKDSHSSIPSCQIQIAGLHDSMATKSTVTETIFWKELDTRIISGPNSNINLDPSII